MKVPNLASPNASRLIGKILLIIGAAPIHICGRSGRVSS